MLKRVFNVAGLIVRIAEWKVCVLAASARRSAIALLGYFVAAIIAFGGLMALLGAGYVALEEVVGASLAMVAVGAVLLLIASAVWLIARGRGRGTGEDLSEHDARSRLVRDEEMLLRKLGMNTDEAKAGTSGDERRVARATVPESVTGIDNPKVILAAGFAMLGLLGPVRLLRTVRIATAVGSIAALANRAINEHRDKRGTLRVR